MRDVHAAAYGITTAAERSSDPEAETICSVFEQEVID